MNEAPEEFLPDIQSIIDAAETGEKGCLLPELDDPKEETGSDDFTD